MSKLKAITFTIIEEKEYFHFEKTGNYEKISDIGEGTFGKVLKVKRINNNNEKNSNIFALKICKKYNKDNSLLGLAERPNEILLTEIMELSILKQIKKINNPYLIKYIDRKINKEDNEIWILMKYFPIDLRTYFNDNLNIINETIFKNIAFQILSGLNSIHKSKIIHNDIKPENILYDPQKNIIQITDFGLSHTFNFDIHHKYKVSGGTYPYLPPDVLLGNLSYFISLDIWSLGCVLIELCTGEVIFKGNNYLDILEKIEDIFGSLKELLPGYNILALKKKVNLPEKEGEGKGLINYIKENQKIKFANDDFYDLILKMLCIDPVKRITAEDAMKHRWFRNSP